MTEAENKVRMARQLVRAACELLELAMQDTAGTLTVDAAKRVDVSVSALRDLNHELLLAEKAEVAQ